MTIFRATTFCYSKLEQAGSFNRIAELIKVLKQKDGIQEDELSPRNKKWGSKDSPEKITKGNEEGNGNGHCSCWSGRKHIVTKTDKSNAGMLIRLS